MRCCCHCAGQNTDSNVSYYSFLLSLCFVSRGWVSIMYCCLLFHSIHFNPSTFYLSFHLSPFYTFLFLKVALNVLQLSCSGWPEIYQSSKNKNHDNNFIWRQSIKYWYPILYCSLLRHFCNLDWLDSIQHRKGIFWRDKNFWSPLFLLSFCFDSPGRYYYACFCMAVVSIISKALYF